MDKPNKYLLVVGGPTAAGKTALAIALARRFSTEILSADSRQFYREMRVGNARPSEEELAAAPHHFIADRSLTEPLTAGEFARQARTLLAKLFEKHDHVVLVGGSGLYIRALTEGLDDFPDVDPAVRQRVNRLYEREGLSALQAAVAEHDPAYFAEVDRQNPARLRRALEVCWTTGLPYSGFRGRDRVEEDFQAVYFQPVWPRDLLYDRINERVERMIAAGLEVEAEALRAYRDEPALRTVGYQEWWPYFAGETDRPAVIRAIQQNSRRYAKRQLTWNRRDGYWRNVPYANLPPALDYLQLIREKALRLSALPDSETTPVLHSREERRRVGLVAIGTGAVRADVLIVMRKTWALLLPAFAANDDDLTKTILLREAAWRAERPSVYLYAEPDDTEWPVKLGWQPAAVETLPEPLRERTGKAWVWMRSRSMGFSP